MTPNKLMPAIIVAIETNGGEFHGTNELARACHATDSVHYMMIYARRLADMGEITIHSSGRGRGRKTVYKRNPNQDGQPRRTG